MQTTLSVGGCGNNCFGHVLVTVRQGQRRDAVATGEEQLGKCAARKSKCIRLYLISPTHKRTEGRAPCGALSLLQKDAALQGGGFS